MKRKISNTLIYIVSVLIPLAIGGLAALLTMDEMQQFEQINKPAITPPSVVFSIVWTILYVLMGISSGLIVTSKAKRKEKTSSLAVYGFTLALNFAWTLVFFAGADFLTAFVLLVALWVSIFIMILKFAALRPWAGILQIPYLLWVTFAGYINYMVYVLN